MAEHEADYLHLLEAHDDLRGWYNPPNFDYAAAERRFLAFAHELQAAFGVECWVESGQLVQDSSFLGHIDLPPACFNRDECVSDSVFLRVSNWGNMAAINDDSALEPEWLAQTKTLLDRFRYVYIPSRVLRRPYRRLRLRGWSRPHLYGLRRMTWWERYFDYL